MIPSMTLLASCETHASANGIKLPKSHFASNFICFELGIAMVPLMVLSTLHDADSMTVTSCDANTDVNGITLEK